MTIAAGHRVRVRRDIYRTDHETRLVELYAEKGLEGLVVECFRSQNTGWRQRPVWYAKVRIPPKNEILTLRLTSLERVR